MKEEEAVNDLPVWRWLKVLVMKLGEDGMSSDESNTNQQTGLPIYQMKNMKWQRKMTYQLDLIDKQRVFDKDIYASRGIKPVVQIRDERNGDSRRVAAVERPKKLYCATWLQKQTPQKCRKLMVSDEEFQWLSIIKC